MSQFSLARYYSRATGMNISIHENIRPWLSSCDSRPLLSLNDPDAHRIVKQQKHIIKSKDKKNISGAIYVWSDSDDVFCIYVYS